MPIGIELEADTLSLVRGRDFKWSFENLDENNQPVAFPAGSLFIELATGVTPTLWNFTIDGTQAHLKVESTAADLIPARTKWQLVFLAEGEAAGGDPLALGLVEVQGA